MKQILVLIADGVEEIEAVVVIDMFVRAGWTVKTVGVTGMTITASRGVRILADCTLDNLVLDGYENYDALVIPGGSRGVAALAGNRGVIDLAKNICNAGKIVGAICAGPLVLQQAGLLKGRKVTSYPSVAPRLSGAQWEDSKVVIDGNIVTSQGPGTSFDFVLAILRLANEGETAQRVAKDMLLP